MQRGFDRYRTDETILANKNIKKHSGIASSTRNQFLLKLRNAISKYHPIQQHDMHQLKIVRTTKFQRKLVSSPHPIPNSLFAHNHT